MRVPAAFTIAALILISTGCRQGEALATASAITGGNPERGREAIRTYGCHTCHTIPGVRGARAVVGPPLDRLGVRSYIRTMPNTPDNLIRWIRHPKQINPQTPMPDTGVTEADARDIAAYLYTLK